MAGVPSEGCLACFLTPGYADRPASAPPRWRPRQDRGPAETSCENAYRYQRLKNRHWACCIAVSRDMEEPGRPWGHRVLCG